MVVPVYSLPGVDYKGERPLDNYPEYTCLYPNKYLDHKCETDCPPRVRDRAKCIRNGWDVKRRKALEKSKKTDTATKGVIDPVATGT